MTDDEIRAEAEEWLRQWIKMIGGRPENGLYSSDTVLAGYVAAATKAQEKITACDREIDRLIDENVDMQADLAEAVRLLRLTWPFYSGPLGEHNDGGEIRAFIARHSEPK